MRRGWNVGGTRGTQKPTTLRSTMPKAPHLKSDEDKKSNDLDRKKLKLIKEQSAYLEESFKEHKTCLLRLSLYLNVIYPIKFDFSFFH
ncbi:homeobox-leucine zipper protein [Sarracenia purpurea var. burkii]